MNALYLSLTYYTGKVYMYSKFADIGSTIRVLRYYAGWADKNQGKVIEVSHHQTLRMMTGFDKIKLDERH